MAQVPKRLFGRRKILSDAETVTDKNIIEILDSALVTHEQNRGEIDYLIRYRKGEQPILERTKQIRKNINNKIVVNIADEVVSFWLCMQYGKPVQYVSRGSTELISADIQKLNDVMLMCGKARKDIERFEWALACGTSYEIILPNAPYINRAIVPALQRGNTAALDEAPYNVYVSDPRNTFIVYNSGLGEPPIMGVRYVMYDRGKPNERTVYSVYTSSRYYEVTEAKSKKQITKNVPFALGVMPIVEYPLTNTRQGALEIISPILDTINSVISNSVDGIEQFIEYLTIFYNCEVDAEALEKLKEYGAIQLKSFGENKADVKILNEQLDQTQTLALVNYLRQMALQISGMPNNSGDSGASTSDTGRAVELRNNYNVSTMRADLYQMMADGGEREMLKVVLPIMRATVGTSLTIPDIEIKFTRGNYENNYTKAMILTTMLGSDKIAPKLAFTHCGMFPDPEDAANMSAEHYAKVQSELERELNAPV